MEIVVKRLDLLRELGVASRLAEVKSTIPVYNFSRIASEADGVQIFATNGESSLRTSCPAVVQFPGVVLVPTKTLHGVAKAASKEDLTLKLDNGRVRVTCGKFSSVLQTLDVNDFPQFQDVEGDPVVLPAKALRSSIARVKFVVEAATAKSQGRDWAKGALLELGGGTVSLVATDGHRVAKVTVPTDTICDDSALIPGKALTDIEALLDVDDDVLTFAHDDNRAVFSVGARTYTTQVMAAQFPAYGRIVSQLKSTNRAEVDRDAWRELIARVRLVSSDMAMRIDLSFKEDTLTARMCSVEIGEAVEQLPVTMSKGDGWETGFDHRYIAEFLAAADPGVVTIEQGNGDGAIAAFKSGAGYHYICCPMRPV